jgi:predicted metal-dependent hydrolase
MQNELLVKDINAAIKARLKNKMQKYALVKTDNRINEAIQGFAKAYPKIRVKQLVDAAAQQCFEGVE